MKKIIATIALGMLTSLAGAQDATSQPAGYEMALNQAKQASKALAETLMTRLTQAVQDSGPQGAIAVCNQEAMQLTQDIARRYQVDIKRVSNRYRNPANAANAEESQFIAEAQQRLAAGEKPDSLVKVSVNSVQGKQYLLLYKAMVMPKLGELGHGRNMDAPTRAALARYYPADKASGYQAGDVRGLIVTRVEMH